MILCEDEQTASSQMGLQNFYAEDSEALAQAVKRGCECSIPGGSQGQVDGPWAA